MVKSFNEFLNEENINDLKDEIREDINNKLVKLRKSNKIDDSDVTLLHFSVDEKTDEVEWMQFFVELELLDVKPGILKDLKRIGKGYGCNKDTIDEVKSSVWLER